MLGVWRRGCRGAPLKGGGPVTVPTSRSLLYQPLKGGGPVTVPISRSLLYQPLRGGGPVTVPTARSLLCQPLRVADQWPCQHHGLCMLYQPLKGGGPVTVPTSRSLHAVPATERWRTSDRANITVSACCTSQWGVADQWPCQHHGLCMLYQPLKGGGPVTVPTSRSLLYHWGVADQWPCQQHGLCMLYQPVRGGGPVTVPTKLQALVYDILPSTTAVFSYARKLSANEQFFVGAQTVVSFLQTTRIISDVCFITDHVATPAQIKPKSFESRQNFFFYPGWMRLMYTCVLGRYVTSAVILVPETFGGRWPRRRTAARR